VGHALACPAAAGSGRAIQQSQGTLLTKTFTPPRHLVVQRRFDPLGNQAAALANSHRSRPQPNTHHRLHPHIIHILGRVDTVTNLTAVSHIIQAATDSFGQIADWQIEINYSGGGPLIQSLGPTSDQVDCCADLALTASHEGQGSNGAGDNGSWNAPEPSPFVLAATALLALAFMVRKRVSQGIR
jgi:hypothetical protein